MSNEIQNFIHKNEIEFLKEPNEEDYLWRYMDLNKFLSFILEKKLHLARFDQLDDVHEGISNAQIIKKLALHKLERESNGSFAETLIKVAINATDRKFDWSGQAKAKILQKLYYTNCWIIGKRESMAMWGTFSNKDSVAIKIRYKELKDIFKRGQFRLKELDGFYKIKLGKIQYVDFINMDEDLTEIAEIEKIGFAKDLSYQHENEFRICLLKSDPEATCKKYKVKPNWTNEDDQNLNSNTGLSLELSDFENMPFEIIFHPKADEFSKNNIRSLLKKCDINFETSDSEIILR